MDQASALRARLLVLVDADAAAFAALLTARRADGPTDAAAHTAAEVPLDIARACAALVTLSAEVGAAATGAVRGDVQAARHLATAALAAALDLAQQDLAPGPEGERARVCSAEIKALRAQ